MFEKQVLDFGYLKVIETWGSDEGIVESARMSTGKGFLGWGEHSDETCSRCGGVGDVNDGCPDPHCTITCDGCLGTGKTYLAGDEKFLRFLYENKHASPFEFAGMTIEVQAPLMVFREWHRHRTQSYSERSARYAPLPAVDYLPTPERCLMLSKTNRQAGALKGSKELTLEAALRGLSKLSELYERSERTYQELLADGFPKELARLANTVGRYSAMRASTDLRNWLAFTTLRSASFAQWEIQQYSRAAEEALATAFPRTTALFRELRRGP